MAIDGKFRRIKDGFAEMGCTLRQSIADLGPACGSLGEATTPFDAHILKWLYMVNYGFTLNSLQLNSMAWACSWHKYGLPTFSLTEGLAAKLLLTDPGSVVADEARPPFPAFFIELPDGYLTCDAMGDGARERVSLPYISFHSTPRIEISDERAVGHLNFDLGSLSAKKVIDELVRMQTKKREFLASSAGREWWRVTGYGRTFKHPSVHDIREAPFASAALGDWVHEEVESVGEGGELTDRELRSTKAMRTIVVNLMLYLGSLPKFPQCTVSRAKAHRGRFGGINTYHLGRKIKLSADLRAAAKDHGAQTPKAGWKLRSRFTVRGHWRNQSCGPGRTQLKRLWVNPYWKGPDVGSQIAREYDVSE